MTLYLVALVLVLIAFLAITLDKAYFYLSVAELRCRAERDKLVAPALLSVARYGLEARLLLGAIALLAAAGGLAIFVQLAPAVLGFGVILIVILLAFLYHPRTRVTSVGVRLAVWSAPVVAWCLRSLQQGLRPIANWLNQRPNLRRHTGMYDRADLVELLQRQTAQRDNRLSAAEVARLQRALRFSELTVSDVMTPRKSVKAVDAREAISPILIDELHQAGHPCFPVYEDKPTHIVGVLTLEHIADVRQHGVVQESMDTQISYLRQADSLEQALDTFYQTRRHLFIVTSTADKYVGILTLTDLLHQLAG